MSDLDKDYAARKLELLLRDLNNYNAGEFWREMSRIASGATGEAHAEQLQQVIEAHEEAHNDTKRLARELGKALGWDATQPSLCDLVKVAEQQQQQLDLHVDMVKQLQQERDALAAHVERLQVHLKQAHEFVEGTDAFGAAAKSGILQDGENKETAWDIDESKRALFESTPPTSLAERDARVINEAVFHCRERITRTTDETIPELNAYCEALADIQSYANKLRQQAKGGE